MAISLRGVTRAREEAMRALTRAYPFLVAVVPVLNVLAGNDGKATLDDLAVILAAVLAGCGILYAAIALAARGRWGGRLPPLAVLAAVLWFWGYPVVFDRVSGRERVWPHLVLIPLALVATVAIVRWLLRRPATLDRMATFLTLTGGLLVCWSGLSIALAELRSARALKESALVRQLAKPIPVRPGAALEPRRDIYLIVLDEYANAGVTRELYGFDNRVFLDSLRQLGFIVPVVHSNYLMTALSLPSLLNSSQIAEGLRYLGGRTNDPTVPDYLVAHNRTVRFLKSQGYRYAFFPSLWWIATRHTAGADFEARVWRGVHPARELSTTGLRRRLRNQSIIGFFKPESAWEADDADHVRRSLAAIAEVPKMPGPVFTFAHVINPHRPIVFGPDCRRPTRPDTGTGRGDAYVGQIECLDRLVLATVTTILRESKVPPVILLQGDHGSKSLQYQTASSAEAIPVAAARERVGAFGAYYLPEGGAAAFGDTVGVVNVMGNVLRYYLGADLPRQPQDDIYLSVDRVPYVFKRVDFAVLEGKDSLVTQRAAAGRQ
jgi:hypothetical protein